LSSISDYKNSEPVTVAVINFNGEEILGETLTSIERLNYPDLNIILIDDSSTDRSLELVRKDFPDVKIIKMDVNTGRPNKLRNIGIMEAGNRLVFLVDNDVVFDTECLRQLVKTLKSSPDIAICTPRLLYHDQPERINIAPSSLHYIGTSISPKRDALIKDAEMDAPEPTIGGGIMLIDKEKAIEIGLLDEDFPMGWGEDGEIYMRMRLAGFRTLYVPGAVGYHRSKEWKESRYQRAFGQVRNRWFILLTQYSIKTLILIIPALILYEIFLLLFMAFKGIPHLYFKGNIDVIKNLGRILEKRKSIQATRKVPDREALTSGDMYVSPSLIQNPFLKIGVELLNGFFNVYWKIVKRWI
jgi:GT2 family glycosyltransferase